MKEEKSTGLLSGLRGFLKMIEEMEKKGLTEQVKAGELEGPSGSKIRYAYRTRIGLGLRPGSREGFASEAKEPSYKTTKGMPAKRIKLDDVKEKGNMIKITAELPKIKERDLDLRIEENSLKIVVKTPEGKIERRISIPNESKVEKIEDASFKNGILEVWLKKKEVK